MTNLTNEYLDTVDLSDIDMIWLDDYWSIKMEFSPTKGQDTNDRLELWVYFNNALLTTINTVEQLDYFWYGIFKEPVRRVWKK